MKRRDNEVYLWLLVVAALLVILAAAAHGESRLSSWQPLTPAPRSAFGQALVDKVAASAPAPKPAFFAVTAYNIYGLEGANSAELSFSFPPGSNSINLAWSEADTNATGFRLYWGTNSGNYLWQQDAGSALGYTIPQVYPLAPLVPVYYTVYGQSSTNLNGPFTDLPVPIARLTNGQGMPLNFYRLRVFSSTNALDAGTNPAQ